MFVCVTDLSVPTTREPTNDSNAPDTRGGLSDDVITIIAAVCGSIIAILIITLIMCIGCYWCHRYRRQRNLHDLGVKALEIPGITPGEAIEIIREARIRPDDGEEEETGDMENANKSETSEGDQSPVVPRATCYPSLDQTDSSQEPPPNYETATSTNNHEQCSHTEASSTTGSLSSNKPTTIDYEQDVDTTE